MDLFEVFQKNEMMIMKNFVYIQQKIGKQKFKSINFEKRKFFFLFLFFESFLFRLKEKKLLEQSIAKLREINRDDDDEIKRQLYTEQIKWWIKQSEEDIIALKGFYFKK